MNDHTQHTANQLGHASSQKGTRQLPGPLPPPLSHLSSGDPQFLTLSLFSLSRLQLSSVPGRFNLLVELVSGLVGLATIQGEKQAFPKPSSDPPLLRPLFVSSSLSSPVPSYLLSLLPPSQTSQNPPSLAASALCRQTLSFIFSSSSSASRNLIPATCLACSQAL